MRQSADMILTNHCFAVAASRRIVTFAYALLSQRIREPGIDVIRCERPRVQAKGTIKLLAGVVQKQPFAGWVNKQHRHEA